MSSEYSDEIKNRFQSESAVVPTEIELGHSENRRWVLLYCKFGSSGSLTLALPLPFARRHSDLLAKLVEEVERSEFS